MKAFQLTQAGVSHLQEVSIDYPHPRANEIVVRMLGSSLNARDRAVISGAMPGLQWPLVPLSDGLGEVVQIGDEVSRFKPGDRVCAMFYPKWLNGPANPGATAYATGGTSGGVMCEYFTRHEDSFSFAPAYLTDIEAATLCCAGLTAWNALVDIAQARPGDTVLLMGTGGVSIFGLQFAVMLGAKTIVISSSDEKLERAKNLGAHHLVNYRRTPDWAYAILELTGGVGADVVLDVGGSQTLNNSIQALAHGGMVCLAGVLTGAKSDLMLMPLLRKLGTIRAVAVGSRHSFEKMCAAMAVSRIRPVIDRCFSSAQISEALDYLASGAHFGKIGITLD